jgi:Zn-dependent M28 family amino/carboxypeptidase
LQKPGSISVSLQGRTTPLVYNDDIYLSTIRPVERARIEAAPVVFVGYGVHAPERQWDDFKDIDLKGKVAVFLVNDPDFEAQPGEDAAGKFGGRTMTYYGRWSYKFEEAARRGAIAALVVHEEEAAGYGWASVYAPGGEGYDVVRPADAIPPVLLQGWIHRDAAARLLKSAELDFDRMKVEARKASFRAVELPGLRMSADFKVEVARAESRNVIGKISGTKRPDETVLFAAHWDSYGIGAPDAQGRTVKAGAADNAVGVAAVMEIARAFKAGPRPDRTLLFAAWTLEERGLLGAQYFAGSGLYPAERMVGNVTLDVLQTAGPARDVILIGGGQSDLEDRLSRAAGSRGRAVTPDAQPQRGLFYRSDHFPFAKKGVPVLLLMALGGGVDLVEGGRAAGAKWVADYTANCYHQPCDTWSPALDFRGAAQDAALAYEVGRALAFSTDWPTWKPGSEFKSNRDRSSEARKR